MFSTKQWAHSKGRTGAVVATPDVHHM